MDANYKSFVADSVVNYELGPVSLTHEELKLVRVNNIGNISN